MKLYCVQTERCAEMIKSGKDLLFTYYICAECGNEVAIDFDVECEK